MSKTILMNGQAISPQELISKVAIPHSNDAFSPIVSIDKIVGGHRVTIVDINGSKSFDILDGVDGKDGADGINGTNGVSPTINIEEIDNGYKLIIKDANSEQSINVLNGQNGKDGIDGKSFTYADFTSEQLAKLKGEKGDRGADGSDGYSPTFSIEEKDNGYSLTITAKDKTETIDIKNGSDGAQGIPGTPGENGTTPIKGVDYFTESDISEIVTSVIAALPKYNGEVITS